jgi:hypothetical protein
VRQGEVIAGFFSCIGFWRDKGSKEKPRRLPGFYLNDLIEPDQ